MMPLSNRGYGRTYSWHAPVYASMSEVFDLDIPATVWRRYTSLTKLKDTS